MKSLTLIVLTYNEELHLARCLESVRGLASQIIIVDSGSTDKTLEIARAEGANVYHHEFKNQAEQFNWALENAGVAGEWVLRLDADEYLLLALKEEIESILSKELPTIHGFYMKRRVFFMGRWIRHGGYYPRWFLRLWKNGSAKSEPREMDEHIVLLKGEAGKLKNDFVDENLRDLKFFTEKHNGFSSREAMSLLLGDKGEHMTEEDKKRVTRKGLYMNLPLFFRAMAYFKWRYIFRGGFLDGMPGLIFHFLQGFWYRFLIDAKVYEARRKSKV
jgi:glycosyltransferase involved in cell wall biosynthesis